MQVSSAVISFHSIAINCEHGDIIEYPAEIRVVMKTEVWNRMVNSLKNIEFSNASIEVLDGDGIEYTAFSENDVPIDLYDDFDDPLELRCYKLYKSNTDKPILFVMLQAKYHDTFTTYELRRDSSG